MTSVNSVYYNLFYFYNNLVCSFFVEFLFNKFFLVKKRKTARLTARHFIGYIPENKRRKCEVCTQDKSVGFKGSRIRTWCSDCGVGLCIGDCFRRYHTLQTP